MKLLYQLLFVLALCSCGGELNNSKSYNINNIPVPSKQSGMSRVYTSPNGAHFLSWVEYINDTTFQFQYAQLENNQWSEPVIIAEGEDWFVNWADFPSLIQSNDGRFTAHWLQMRGSGTYEYDIHISQSVNDQDWTESFIPHRDSIAAEHGFLSMTTDSDGKVVAVWLDGRNTVTNNSNDGHMHGGAMTLRTASISKDQLIDDEYLLDRRICDCCQTDIAISNKGPIVVYRDRSSSEIRDISIVRKIAETWTEPVPVYSDQWKFNACPVNGPALAVQDNTVGVVWYSGAYDAPRVQLALSHDYGANFLPPLLISQHEVIGRVDITNLNSKEFFVTWVEGTNEGARIQSKVVSTHGDVSKTKLLFETSSSRQSGFPIIAQHERGVLVTWTKILEDKTTRVQSALVKI